MAPKKTKKSRTSKKAFRPPTLAKPVIAPRVNRALRVLVAWPPHAGSVGEDLARTVAWLAQENPLVVRTATVISQTWPQTDAPAAAADQADLYPTASSDLYPTSPDTSGSHGTPGAGVGAAEALGAPVAGSASPTSFTAAREAFNTWLAAEMTAAGESARAALLAAGVPEKMLDEEQLAMVYSDHSETSRLIEAGEEFGADVILLGSQADSPDGRYRMGSTADALLHCSPLPLMLVPRNLDFSKAGPTRVNCAYVDTEQSQQALRHASDLARRWDVPLRLVAFSPAGVSLDPTQVAFGDAVDAAGTGGAGASSAAAPLAEAWQVQAKELLERGRKRALSRHPDLEVTTKTGIGASWEEAVGAIKWRKGDLMVMGSSVLGDFNRVFIGPSTNQILRHVPVPVFLSTV
ncbi:universal stress protein [Corynebacterium sp. HMSC27B11]|uniref:universal stress protein n=1 Tax=Corynebacterium sp. HMSC27B11 TaxID=1581065 RepID=UPI0008A2561F|nr:universal stress protein [Corynebacterium sp. HMSC27B11]OFS16933.1 universal stress protein [Corynebacterium sp. HMSC27B11]